MMVRVRRDGVTLGFSWSDGEGVGVGVGEGSVGVRWENMDVVGKYG